MADRLAELDGLEGTRIDESKAVAARVPTLLDDLVEPAKVTALEKLGGWSTSETDCVAMGSSDGQLTAG